MTQIMRWGKICFVVGGLLAIAPISSAQTQPEKISSVGVGEYQPPTDQRPPQGTHSSTGTRGGCYSNSGASLTLLAPEQHVGRTAASHPTVAWFVPDFESIPVELRLYEYSADGQLKPKPIQTHKLQSSPGLMQFSLPVDKPGLVIGQRYLWQVALLCNPDYPSSDRVAVAQMEVVEIPPAVKADIEIKSDRRQTVATYAKAGLWYDALREALKPASEGKLGATAATLLKNLAQIETKPRSQNLSQIASDNL